MSNNAKPVLAVHNRGKLQEPYSEYNAPQVLPPLSTAEFLQQQDGITEAPYCAPIQEIQKIFNNAEKTAPYRKLYILKHEGHLKGLAMKELLPLNKIYKEFQKESPKNTPTLILALDLSESFDRQIRSGNFNPETLEGWNFLQKNPHNFIKHPPKEII